MHAKEFLHKLLSSVMHQKRLETLIHLVQGLLIYKNLSVTGLGRAIRLPITERSAIRRADRFIGNKKLQTELNVIYSQVIQIVVSGKTQPKIIVDWTHVPNSQNYVLRAALATKGRAVTLYEKTVDKSKLSNAKVERSFLTTLKEMLPADCRPIIITDAGFRNPWFKQVLQLGWDYVGRIRGGHKYFDGRQWISCKELLLKATSAAKHIGKVALCKENKLITHLFLFKGKSKGRVSIKKYRRNQGGNDRKTHCRAAQEPWLLASSFSGENWLKANRVIKIYKLRMQIEEGFRDLKSPKYGFGLRNAHSKGVDRINVLLLVAMLASFIAWLIGCIAEKKKWHYCFQATSIKTRRILSLFYLGCQIVRREIKIPAYDLDNAIKTAQGFCE